MSNAFLLQLLQPIAESGKTRLILDVLHDFLRKSMLIQAFCKKTPEENILRRKFSFCDLFTYVLPDEI